MVKSPIAEGPVTGSWLFLEVSEEEVTFYRRFIERHGGAFVAMAGPERSYRLDFPPGARIARNEELDVPLQDSYHIVYPDGARLTWYRVMKLDRRWMHNVLLAPMDDDEWARFTGATEGATG
jgi:hypothetical protein